MKYTVNLDPKELYALADELDKYADDFEAKVKVFLMRLADVGISVAEANGGVFGSYIVYSKEFEDNGATKIVNLVASGESITRIWYASSKSAEPRTEVINALLMAEFGSGRYAIDGVDGLGGKGTLNLYGHANDPKGWYWWTDNPSTDGEMKTVKDGRFLFHSDGLPPYQPLRKAIKACIEQVYDIAQEVFG